MQKANKLCLIILSTNIIFIDQVCITLTKLHVKLKPNPLRDFLSKGGKSAKTHQLCIIMLLNPFLHNSIGNIIFDFHITIDTVHPVQISSRSDNCITTDMMWKSPKMPKKGLSLKNRGLIPTIQPEPDFSWTCGFREVLDNAELIMYMKFQKLLITRCRDMDKKHQKYIYIYDC